jgi:multidrug efflux system membrane fusion protein
MSAKRFAHGVRQQEDCPKDNSGAGRWWRRGAAVLVPLVAGILLAQVLARSRPPPPRKASSEVPKPVSVIAVPALDLVPTALGYGIAQPGEVWRAVAEVQGRIIEKHPSLERGSLLPKDSLLLRVDPTSFKLRVRELQAGIDAREAQLRELTTRAANARRSLTIEVESLEVARAELGRRQVLAKDGALPQSQLGDQERTVLRQRGVVQSLENELARLPDERAALTAELERDQARLVQARRDVENTVIRLPFAARIAEVKVELNQFVLVGQVLAEADGIAVSEVTAQLALDRFQHLLAPDVPMPASQGDALQTFLRAQGLGASVHLRTAVGPVRWEARVVRLTESLDPITRTAGVVVAVDRPYANARPPEQPPLIKNMYVAVELRGKPQPGTLVIPRSALHGRHVYLVDEDNRLEIRQIQIGFRQDELITVNRGLRAGELVLVADLVPAIAGTLLEPVLDREAAVRLRAQAEGAPSTPAAGYP